MMEQMRNWVLIGAIVTTFVVAVAWRTGTLDRRLERFTNFAVHVEDWEALADGGYVVAGEVGNPVTVVEFSGLRCASCAEAHRIANDVLAKHRVRWVFRHGPSVDLEDFDAAFALECAASRGALRSFQNAYFLEIDPTGAVSWDEVARRAGIDDPEGFDACLKDRTTRDRYDADYDAARAADVYRTPTYVVNGSRVEGVLSREAWGRLIEHHRARAR